ncbi:hypothetical protein [Pedomonas mirosovicensis]|uniref:hypothetical protein n=1 Tax=Pedomonas mirosovicensis TaxID=2908641 RepID=UPI0021679232|nr:hypothetical protein [Pedomonas mirosovicensis]MCH8685955.1 hypothetical protein [Pedomonas mirosovicensis]
MAESDPSEENLLAVAAPRSRRAAALMDLLIYERGLDLGAVSPIHSRITRARCTS